MWGRVTLRFQRPCCHGPERFALVVSWVLFLWPDVLGEPNGFKLEMLLKRELVWEALVLESSSPPTPNEMDRNCPCEWE